MRLAIAGLFVLSFAASVQAQCLMCSAIEKKLRLACENSFAAMAAVAEKFPAQFDRGDPKKLRAATPDYCKCTYEQAQQTLPPSEIEMLVEAFTLNEKTHTLMLADLDGNAAARQDYRAHVRRQDEFTASMMRMIGKDKLEKNSWLTNRFCSPMIENVLPDKK